MSKRVQLIIKRVLDVVLAAILLVVLSPLMLLVAIAIRVTMGKPVFFKQLRAGYREKPFVLVKFRTMREREGADGLPLSDSERLTKVGRFLRKATLDELPQLWNVLKGDMSLVGPRPLLVEYLKVYTPYHRRRHEVMPGMAGWALVNGRQALLHSQRRDMDVWYVDHWSLGLDFKILWMALGQVLTRRGVRPEQKMSDVDDLGLAEALKSSRSIKVE